MSASVFGNTTERQDDSPRARLRGFIERIERLNEEKAALGAAVKTVYSEAKTEGLDVKVLRGIILLRKLDPEERHRLAYKEWKDHS